LSAGEAAYDKTGEDEHLLVLIEGRGRLTIDGKDHGVIGGRTDIFSREKAHGAYVPGGDHAWEIVADGSLEVAVCKAPFKGGPRDIRIIAPDHDPMEARGKGANTRYVNAIMMEERDWADSLLVTEVWTPNGNWSSYPSHKHDTDAFPAETYLEETYYHRLDPGELGWGYQRVYNDDLSLNENMAVHDRDLVLVPEGYHPCGAPYGFDLYYLNVMAGPKRKWRFTNDPRSEHIFVRDGGKKPE
jgi:5-deoxy-glucuronate isomerase